MERTGERGAEGVGDNAALTFDRRRFPPLPPPLRDRRRLLGHAASSHRSVPGVRPCVSRSVGQSRSCRSQKSGQTHLRIQACVLVCGEFSPVDRPLTCLTLWSRGTGLTCHAHPQPYFN